MQRLNPIAVALLLLAPFSNCDRRPAAPEQAITADLIEAHVKTLSSDAFLGRQPGTAGEPVTLGYLEEQFREMGIKPALGGSYLQEFTITEIAPVPPEEMVIKKGADTYVFRVKEDFIAGTSFVDEPITVSDREIVFAGFGIVAPEYQWDDYKDVDVTDKIVLVLYNDPGLYTQDSTLFLGAAPSPYSTSAYKKGEALKRGAAGVLTIFHDTGLTGLNWGLVQAMATRPTRYLEGQEPPVTDLIPFSGMISIEMAQTILKASGNDPDYLKAALGENFRPVPLGVTASVEVLSRKRSFKTSNVLGVLEGATRPDEAIVYTAHWDHDGYVKGGKAPDSVYNGAIDNATGVAMVLETARAYAALRERPQRSVLFFLTAAEEMGLLGSKYYVEHPVFPPEKTVCVINADASHATEPMRIAVNVTKGYSGELDRWVDSAAASLGREIIPDPMPQIGAFYRSDHFPFVEKGIPAAWCVGGGDPMAGDSTEQMQIIEAYSSRYHQLDDEYYDGFIARNIAFDAQLNFLIGYYLSNSEQWPNWNEGTEYRELRDRSRAR